MILKAAEIVFARKGFNGSRLTEIAAAAGLPKANLLYYFRSKEGLYRAVCSDILETWLHALGDISADDKPDEALQSYIKAKMDLSRRRPDASKVFAMEIISGAPVMGDYLRQDLKDWVDQQAKVFKIWQSRGEMAEGKGRGRENSKKTRQHRTHPREIRQTLSPQDNTDHPFCLTKHGERVSVEIGRAHV